jgi:prepilin peptidase CpaA
MYALSMPAYASASAGPLTAVLVVVLLLAVWFDVSERRIPNWLTAGGLLAALLARSILGWDALLLGILGGAVGFVVGIALFAIGAMGAGDGKLLTSVGAALGLETFLWSLPLVGVFGGLLVLAVTIWNGTFFDTIRRFRELLFFVFTFGLVGEHRTLSTPGAVAVPYGVAVAAGAVTAWLGWGVTS